MKCRTMVVALIATASVLAAAGVADAPTQPDPVPALGGHEQMVQTRSRFFGAANVDQVTGAVRRDRLIASWFGVTGYALAIRGHVVLLDAYIPRGLYSGYVPATPTDLANLRPERIFIGHGHFDHAADATPVAIASGATLVATAEQCADLRSRASSATPPACVATSKTAEGIGFTGHVDGLAGVQVTTVRHPHSAGTSKTGEDTPFTPLPTDTIATHPPTAEDAAFNARHQSDQENGSTLYRFAVGNFTMVWNDTAGPLVDKNPGLIPKLRALGPVDLELGSISGFNMFTNGFRDPRSYIQALRPKVFVPGHMDDWFTAPLSTRAVNAKAPFLTALQALPAADRPEVRFLEDPQDYVRPAALTFAVPLVAPRLKLTCRGSRPRATLTGDVSDVDRVDFSVGSRRVSDRAAPFAARFATRAGRRSRVSARIVFFNGEALTLKGVARACARP